MRVLMAHVRYRLPGGEDAAFDRDLSLLRDAGVEVLGVDPSSYAFDELRFSERLSVALSRGDHAVGRGLIRQAIDEFAPDVVHFHNLHPLLGVGAMAEASGRAAVVQTLHNYRLSCIAGTHMRSGALCEACTPGRRREGVLGACYRSSRLQSLVMSQAEDARWRLMQSGLPDTTLCLTEFAARRVGAFAPAATVRVVPNSVPAGEGLGRQGRDGTVFIGRLSAEKGALELVRSWPLAAPVLTIVGDGPDEAACRREAEGKPVRFLGRVEAAEARALLRRSLAVVIPSRCFEGLPTVMLEALAEGTPPVAFDLGGMSVLSAVDERLLAPAFDADALVRRALDVATLPAEEWSALARACVEEHASTYANVGHVAALLDVYRDATRAARPRVNGAKAGRVA